MSTLIQQSHSLSLLLSAARPTRFFSRKSYDLFCTGAPGEAPFPDFARFVLHEIRIIPPRGKVTANDPWTFAQVEITANARRVLWFKLDAFDCVNLTPGVILTPDDDLYIKLTPDRIDLTCEAVLAFAAVVP